VLLFVFTLFDEELLVLLFVLMFVLLLVLVFVFVLLLVLVFMFVLLLVLVFVVTVVLMVVNPLSSQYCVPAVQSPTGSACTFDDKKPSVKNATPIKKN
jgi:glucan phosphoethanolaminetransferase (alkaline phosphatase superfamily)